MHCTAFLDQLLIAGLHKEEPNKGEMGPVHKSGTDPANLEAHKERATLVSAQAAPRGFIQHQALSNSTNYKEITHSDR